MNDYHINNKLITISTPYELLVSYISSSINNKSTPSFIEWANPNYLFYY